jgi:hypothetical protein
VGLAAIGLKSALALWGKVVTRTKIESVTTTCISQSGLGSYARRYLSGLQKVWADGLTLESPMILLRNLSGKIVVRWLFVSGHGSSELDMTFQSTHQYRSFMTPCAGGPWWSDRNPARGFKTLNSLSKFNFLISNY